MYTRVSILSHEEKNYVSNLRCYVHRSFGLRQLVGVFRNECILISIMGLATLIDMDSITIGC